MKPRHLLAFASIVLCSFNVHAAADLVGHWTSDFDSQIGPQKYTYDFSGEGADLTGKATYDHSMGKGESKLTAIKISGDSVSFIEPLKIEGNEITITYSGKISGDEMKLTRQVGEFGTEEIVAKRAPSAPAKARDTK